MTHICVIKLWPSSSMVICARFAVLQRYRALDNERKGRGYASYLIESSLDSSELCDSSCGTSFCFFAVPTVVLLWILQSWMVNGTARIDLFSW